MITIYTDGSCYNQWREKRDWLPYIDAGGIGVVIMDSEQNELLRIHENYEYTTNNKMELLAIYRAFCVVNSVRMNDDITVYSDSQYALWMVYDFYTNSETGKMRRGYNFSTFSKNYTTIKSIHTEIEKYISFSWKHPNFVWVRW